MFSVQDIWVSIEIFLAGCFFVTAYEDLMDQCDFLNEWILKFRPGLIEGGDCCLPPLNESLIDTYHEFSDGWLHLCTALNRTKKIMIIGLVLLFCVFSICSLLHFPPGVLGFSVLWFAYSERESRKITDYMRSTGDALNRVLMELSKTQNPMEN